MGVVADAGGGQVASPLSAKLLPPTIPEIEGLSIARPLRFHGRRRPLIELATAGHPRIPVAGYALRRKISARKACSSINRRRRWEFELLNTGRHFASTGDQDGRRPGERGTRCWSVFSAASGGADGRASVSSAVGPLVGPAGGLRSSPCRLLVGTRQCDPIPRCESGGGQCHVRRARLAEAVQQRAGSNRPA